MNNKFSYMVFFGVGLTVGSVATWQYARKKYEQRVHDDIDSVKKVLLKEPIVVQKEKSSKQTAEEAIAKMYDYASIISEQGYTNYSRSEQIKKEEKENNIMITEGPYVISPKENNIMITEGPYVISPDDFSAYDDYEKISLTYYADQVLADDDDELIEDIAGTVGYDSLTSFGEYEDDSVFVRNDQLKCDYEILLDHRKYLDIVNVKPHGVDE